MRIKKFTAKNYADALEQVKRELGEDALIMSTRSIKPESPLSGRSVANKVEITAAIEFEEPVAANIEAAASEPEIVSPAAAVTLKASNEE